MTSMRVFGGAVLLALVSSCVTINVYFPAAAAERAADRIIDEVWGEQGAPAQPEPQSRLAERVLLAVLDVLLPAAHAQADLDISSPAIERITAQMSQRHDALRAWYQSGAVGQTRDGLVAVRDAKAIPLKDRNEVNNLVAKENLDRNALYREIALANQHPEWEADIRATFARRWATRAAQEGWWYEGGGGWQQG